MSNDKKEGKVIFNKVACPLFPTCSLPSKLHSKYMWIQCGQIDLKWLSLINSGSKHEIINNCRKKKQWKYCYYYYYYVLFFHFLAPYLNIRNSTTNSSICICIMITEFSLTLANQHQIRWFLAVISWNI